MDPILKSYDLLHIKVISLVDSKIKSCSLEELEEVRVERDSNIALVKLRQIGCVVVPFGSQNSIRLLDHFD